MKQGAPSAVDDARPPPLGSEDEKSTGEVGDYDGDASDSSPEEKQSKAPLQETAPTAEDREITLCEERLLTLLSRSTIRGRGRGCNKCVPVLGGDGTKIARPGGLFDQSPGEMN